MNLSGFPAGPAPTNTDASRFRYMQVKRRLNKLYGHLQTFAFHLPYLSRRNTHQFDVDQRVFALESLNDRRQRHIAIMRGGQSQYTQRTPLLSLRFVPVCRMKTRRARRRYGMRLRRAARCGGLSALAGQCRATRHASNGAGYALLPEALGDSRPLRSPRRHFVF